jgi:hypothetical protein
LFAHFLPPGNLILLSIDYNYNHGLATPPHILHRKVVKISSQSENRYRPNIHPTTKARDWIKSGCILWDANFHLRCHPSFLDNKTPPEEW